MLLVCGEFEYLLRNAHIWFKNKVFDVTKNSNRIAYYIPQENSNLKLYKMKPTLYVGETVHAIWFMCQ